MSLPLWARAFFGSHFQAAAAWDFHADQGDVMDIVLAKDFCQFFSVVDVVEFRAADEGDAALDEIFVEAGVGIGRAVGSDEQAGTVEIRRMRRYELDLDWPLAQAGNRRSGRDFTSAFRCVREAAGLAAGTAAGIDSSLSGHVLLYGFFVIGGGFAFDKGDGIRRAMGQAIAQTVAIIIAHEAGLAVDHGDSPFVTGRGAGAAAIAFFRINLYNFTYHNFLHRVT